MPFLTKKTSDMSVTSRMASSLRTANAAVWQEDEYRPSNQIASLGGLGFSSSLEQMQQRRLCGNAECFKVAGLGHGEADVGRFSKGSGDAVAVVC